MWNMLKGSRDEAVFRLNELKATTGPMNTRKPLFGNMRATFSRFEMGDDRIAMAQNVQPMQLEVWIEITKDNPLFAKESEEEEMNPGLPTAVVLPMAWTI